MEFIEWAADREREAAELAVFPPGDAPVPRRVVEAFIDLSMYRAVREAFQEYRLAVLLPEGEGLRGQGVEPLGQLSELRDLLRRV